MSLDNAPAGWIRWAMPSIADLIFVALLAALVSPGFSTKLLNDAGIGWHIRAGQQILATHAIPRVDPFSSQIAKPWIAWEWLYDMIVGFLEAKLGLNGVVWFAAVTISAVFAWMFRITIVRGTNPLAALLLTLLAISASMIHFLARPHVLTWLFALAWFWILGSTERHALFATAGLRSTSLWFLPLSMLLWANLHGGFLLGFVFLFLFWVAALLSWLTSKEARIEQSFEKIATGKRVRDLTLIGLLSVVASFVNPHGWKLHAHVVSYLSNPFLMSHIEEFQSPDFHRIAQRCFLVLLLISIATIALRTRQLRVSELLLVLFAVYAALYAARNIPVSSILLVLIVAPKVWTSAGSGFIQRMAAVGSRARGHLWPIVAAVALFAITLNGGRIGSRQVISAQFSPARMPVDAVSYLKQAEVRSPVLSPDYWGGYLIYRLYPEAKVVVDDRHDFYGETFLKPYLKMIHVELGWQDFLNEQTPAALVLPNNSALSQILRQRPDWKAVYADETAVVFLPSDITHKDRDGGNH
jgi:hypothetical protein